VQTNSKNKKVILSVLSVYCLWRINFIIGFTFATYRQYKHTCRTK